MARLLLLGAGHAHLEMIAHSYAPHEVTVISPQQWLYYSGMMPGYLGGRYTLDQARIDVKALCERHGGQFVQGAAQRIYPKERYVALADGRKFEYDVLSCNTGSYVDISPFYGTTGSTGERAKRGPQSMLGNGASTHGTHPSVFPVKPVDNLAAAREAIEKGIARMKKTSASASASSSASTATKSSPQTSPYICSVIGSGAAALEITGNLLQFLHDLTHTEGMSAASVPIEVRLYCDPIPLKYAPARMRRRVMRNLRRRHVRIIDRSRVARIEEDRLILADGTAHRSDVTLAATGIYASPLFVDSDLPTGAKEALLVNKYLQVAEYPNIFGGGDCIAFAPRPLDKVGVYAVRQNCILAHNVGVALDTIEHHRSDGSTAAAAPAYVRPLHPFRPQRFYFFALNLGDGSGAGTKWGITIPHKMAFRNKEKFDVEFAALHQSRSGVIFPVDPHRSSPKKNA